LPLVAVAAGEDGCLGSSARPRFALAMLEY
jgi:hypothetical protein